MPLIVPGINDNDHRKDHDKTWQDILLGKKLGEKSDATTHSKSDLPKNARIIEDGAMVTQDHNPDRISIHLDKDGIVNRVRKG